MSTRIQCCAVSTAVAHSLPAIAGSPKAETTQASIPKMLCGVIALSVSGKVGLKMAPVEGIGWRADVLVIPDVLTNFTNPLHPGAGVSNPKRKGA